MGDASRQASAERKTDSARCTRSLVLHCASDQTEIAERWVNRDHIDSPVSVHPVMGERVGGLYRTFSLSFPGPVKLSSDVTDERWQLAYSIYETAALLTEPQRRA